MEELYSFIFDDPEIFASICGANDKNLSLFEHYFGVPVVPHGNELIIMTDDSGKHKEFDRIVRHLSDSPELNSDNSNEFIASVFHSLAEDRDANVAGIHIPRSAKIIYPKNAKQAAFISAIQNSDLTFGVGPAGTGKTFIATALALQMLLEHQVQRIVLTRPVVEAGENLGFLPGDLIQKITPYLRPLYDIIEYLLPPGIFKKLEEDEQFEVAPLAYMRGRTLFNSVVILDEAQNTTAEQMKMFLTRLGPNSKMIVTGDPGQSDIAGSKGSGLSHAVALLGNIPEIAVVQFTARDVVRHSLVQKIINAYDKSDKKTAD